ncbi:Helicase-like protein [Corchorus olitorius]|uniref:Helicase-like protein n=1 Tax=Corchorus olitorius TaxID=93759 RepID=A0A1R3FVH5_9ROSI|nr:Helicase-like protein [Corchorus olitorius]
MDPSAMDVDPTSIAAPGEMAQAPTYHKRTFYEPAYFGGPDRVCPFCSAHMWYGERCDISKHTENPYLIYVVVRAPTATFSKGFSL